MTDPRPSRGFGARAYATCTGLTVFLCLRAIYVLVIYGGDARSIVEAVALFIVAWSTFRLAIMGQRQFKADLCEAYPLARDADCTCHHCKERK